jgi:hypothetical protein
MLAGLISFILSEEFPIQSCEPQNTSTGVLSICSSLSSSVPYYLGIVLLSGGFIAVILGVYAIFGIVILVLLGPFLAVFGTYAILHAC